MTLLRPGALLLDMGSSDPAQTLRLAPLLRAAGLALVDAPVSGAVARPPPARWPSWRAATPPTWNARVRCCRAWAPR